jgi:2-furoyl-CoA dehydrogenase large subunit
MSTPACIANAIADALTVKDVTLPMTPGRLHALLDGAAPPAAASTSSSLM